MLTFDFLYGEKSQALYGPDKIVLSESLAQRIFGKTNPIGKLLTTKTPTEDNEQDELILLVTGVYEDLPQNSNWIPQAMISAVDRS